MLRVSVDTIAGAIECRKELLCDLEAWFYFSVVILSKDKMAANKPLSREVTIPHGRCSVKWH